MLYYLFGIWQRHSDIPADWIDSLNNDKQEEIKDVSFSIKKEFNNLLDPSIVSNIIKETLVTEIEKWKSTLISLINKRYINKAQEIASKVPGSVSYKLYYIKPEILNLLKERDNVINNISIDTEQVTGITKLAIIDKLDKATLYSLFLIWNRALKSCYTDTINSSVNSYELLLIESCINDTLNTLIDNWEKRSNLNPIKLKERDNKETKQNINYNEVEITKPINKERMEEIKRLLVDKINKWTE